MTTDTIVAKLGAAAAVAGLLGAATIGTASAQEDRADWPRSLQVGTASPGGTYFIYGAGWAGLVQDQLGVATSTEVTGGPVQNFALVQSGDLDLAMTTMGPAFEAWTGQSPIAPGVEMQDVRATFPMYETPFQVAALRGSGISSVEDLQGRAVGVGPAGGTCGTYFPLFFQELGVTIRPQYGGASDLGGQLQDGLIDAFAFCAGLPIAAFSELEATADIALFAFTEDEVEQLVEAFPVSPFTIPAGTYRTVQEDQPTVAMWNFGIAHKDLPESLVYEIMAVVLDNHDRMVQIHSAAEETVPENYDKNTFLPFHAGAVRYFQEKGFELSEDVIPPEYEG
jgi:uncharacterized protein